METFLRACLLLYQLFYHSASVPCSATADSGLKLTQQHRMLYRCSRQHQVSVAFDSLPQGVPELQKVCHSIINFYSDNITKHLAMQWTYSINLSWVTWPTISYLSASGHCKHCHLLPKFSHFRPIHSAMVYIWVLFASWRSGRTVLSLTSALDFLQMRHIILQHRNIMHHPSLCLVQPLCEHSYYFC